MRVTEEYATSTIATGPLTTISTGLETLFLSAIVYCVRMCVIYVRGFSYRHISLLLSPASHSQINKTNKTVHCRGIIVLSDTSVQQVTVAMGDLMLLQYMLSRDPVLDNNIS